jgi:hypothetical protein
MMKGAFESEKAVYSFVPEYVPKPVTYGSYHSRPDMHFYMAEYVEMDDTHPDPKAWAETFSTLHKRSMGRSPEGKFGFHIDTHLANIPQDNTWNSSWEQFFAQIFRSMCEKEEAARGPDANLTRAKKVFHELIIPRYLRPWSRMGGSSTQHCSTTTAGRVTSSQGPTPPRLCVFLTRAPSGVITKVKILALNREMLMSSANNGLCLYSLADVRVTRPNTWNLEAAGEIYRDIMGVSEPREDFDARIEVYATLGLVLRSAMYSNEPGRRVL